jgi:hypothetical protein
MRAELVALLGLVLVATGCSDETCIRDSDCNSGVCSANGVCFVIENDAATDAPDDAATDASADASTDAAVDAPEYRFDAIDTSDAGYRFDAVDITDAAAVPDAAVDASIDAVPWPEPYTGPSPDRASL